MVKILTNGDSWTGGIYLGDRNKLWPGLLGKLLDCKVTNLAIGGASNNRIFRTTCEYIYSGNELPDYIILGWSSLTRYEFTHSSGRHIRLTAIGAPKFDDDSDIENYTNINQFYYNNLFSEKLNYKMFIDNLYVLKDLCDYKKIKLINFMSFEKNNVPNSMIWIPGPGSTMKEYLDGKNFSVMKSGHTGSDGQLYWAKTIANHIQGTDIWK